MILFPEQLCNRRTQTAFFQFLQFFDDLKAVMMEIADKTLFNVNTPDLVFLDDFEDFFAVRFSIEYGLQLILKKGIQKYQFRIRFELNSVQDPVLCH